MLKYLRLALYNRGKWLSRNERLRQIRLAVYNKWKRPLKSEQERWTWFLWNYYKKFHRNKVNLKEKWKIVQAKLIANRIEEDNIKRVKENYKSYKVDVKQLDSFGDNNIGTKIIRSKDEGLLNKSLDLNINHNKWLNFFNSRRNKNKIIFQIKNRKNKNKKKKLMLRLKYVINNISEGYKEDQKLRKISHKLLIPNYYFPSQYIEKSKPGQAKNWISNIYSFIQKEGASITLLDRYTTELIRHFFAVRMVKRRKMGNKLLDEGFKFNGSKSIYKQLNKIIKFSTRDEIKGDSSITTYFHPGILKSKWLRRQINTSMKIKKKLLNRRMNLFGGFETKKSTLIGKWRRILLSKPIFKHTPFNIIIDLFIYNNKTSKLKKLRNMLLRRFAYKYMYSLYVDVYKKVNETISRPRFFYINIIEPKIFPYYTKVVRSYEEWIFKYNRGLVIIICLILIKMNERYKDNIKNLKKKSKFKFSFSKLKNVINNKGYLFNSIYTNILSKSGINYLFNINKKKVDVISMYETEKDKDAEEEKRPYKIKRYGIIDVTTQPLSKKKMRQKLNRIKLRSKRKAMKKKRNERVKVFGEKKLSYNQYKKKQIFERRRGKQMDHKEFKEKLRDFHIHSHQQKQNEKSNEKNYIWYTPEEWERRKKEKKNNLYQTKNKFNNVIRITNNKSNEKYNDKRSNKNKFKEIDVSNIVLNNVSKEKKTKDNILFGVKQSEGNKKTLIPDQKIKKENIQFISNTVITERMNSKNDTLFRLEKPEELKESFSFEQNNFVREEDSLLQTNNYKDIVYKKFFKNDYLLYWNYQILQRNKARFKLAKLSKNKKRKLRLKLENEEKKFEDTNIEILAKHFDKPKLLFIRNIIEKDSFTVFGSKELKYRSKKEKIKSSIYYISKNKLFNKQKKLRKKYALETIEDMNLPIIKKKKRFQKRIKENQKNIMNKSINKISNNNLKIKSKTSKKAWDKLEYSLLSILNKYFSINVKENFQYSSFYLNSIYNEGKNMLLFSNIWYTIYSLNFIKIEYSNITKNILVDKELDTIPEKSNQISNSFIKGKYFNSHSYKIHQKFTSFESKENRNSIFSINSKFYSGFTKNKREDELTYKFFNYDNIFKTYYKKLISFYIMEYYKHYLLNIWRSYWVYALRIFVIDRIKVINKSHVILLNFIIVKTLLGLLEYNYRSIIKLKPKYYYLNKLRYYQTKFQRIHINSWVNSVKYVKRLRKTPNQFWKRYHRLASFYYGRIIQNGELDTKRKIFVPFVLYFEDILYNIYGKWVIIRLWPLKRYYLSSYILARRLMALILWRADKIKTVTRFRRKTRFFLSLVRYLQITRSYYDYYKNSLSEWPNSLLDKINEKKKEHYLTYKNLEYMMEKKERYFKFNTHLLFRNKLSYSNFSLWYKEIVENKLMKQFTGSNQSLKDSKINRYSRLSKVKWLHVWLTPFRQHLHYLSVGHDISSFKFTLAGRTGVRRNNARKMYKMRFYGHTRILRYWAPIQKKFFNIGIPNIRNDMKSTYDYSKTIAKSRSGALSVKVWMTSKISVDIQELLMLLVDIKHLYTQLFNKYFLVSNLFVHGRKKRKKVLLKNWRYIKPWYYNKIKKEIKYNKKFIKFVKRYFLFRRKKNIKINMNILFSSGLKTNKNKYIWNSYYNKLKKQYIKTINI